MHGGMPDRGVMESLSYRSSVGDPQAPQGGFGFRVLGFRVLGFRV